MLLALIDTKWPNRVLIYIQQRLHSATVNGREKITQLGDKSFIWDAILYQIESHLSADREKKKVVASQSFFLVHALIYFSFNY